MRLSNGFTRPADELVEKTSSGAAGDGTACCDASASGSLTRRDVLRGALVASLGLVGFASFGNLMGCTSSDDSEPADGGTGVSGTSGSPADSSGDGAESTSGQTRLVRLGTMPTEDFLPGWVATEEGLFPSSVRCETTVFQSAQELSAAIAAGEIDMAMTDPMVAAALTAGGAQVRLAWVTLGSDPSQGRFGIMTSKDSGITDPSQLRGASIAVGSNTVPEYVMDKLLESLGIGEDDFTKEEVKKVPVRYEMMTAGQVGAAALPASLLALGEAQGHITLIDDTIGDNLSQSVMVVRTAFADAEGGAQAVADVRSGWNAGAERVNADPASYRALLVERASLPEAVATSYPVCAYPIDVLPTSDMVQPVLDWMDAKGYLTQALTFDEQTGDFVVG